MLNHLNTILSAGVVVGLKETFGSGLENVGTIEVCVAVISPGGDCTIESAFDIPIRTIDDDAGRV